MPSLTTEQRAAIAALDSATETIKRVFGYSKNTPPPPPPPGSGLPTVPPPPPPSAPVIVSAPVVSAPKPKKEISTTLADMNKERLAVYEEMKAAWLAKHPEMTDLANAAWVKDAPVSAKKTLEKAIKTAGIENPPTYAQALQEHARRKAAADPAAKAKYNAYRAKVSASQATRKAAKATAVTTPVTASPLVVEPAPAELRPTEEEKPLAVVSPPEAANTPSNVVVTVIRANENNQQAFRSWEHEGKQYFKNGLNYVYKKTSKGGFGEYVGKFDPATNTIDTTVPEPEPNSNNNNNQGGGKRKTRRNRKH